MCAIKSGLPYVLILGPQKVHCLIFEENFVTMSYFPTRKFCTKIHKCLTFGENLNKCLIFDQKSSYFLFLHIFVLFLKIKYGSPALNAFDKEAFA
jgi:hypothetical protein